MKAALCTAFEGPGAISVADIPEPSAGPGEVIVEVAAAALNFFDTLMLRNKYQFKPELPFSPCAEVAGTVAALGDGVTGLAPGDRVCAFIGWGGARERVAVKASLLMRLPASVTFESGAGLTVTYGTAMHGLIDRGRLQPGETLAVLGASGGAGLAAVEIGKRLGARVIAVASSPDKLEVCRRHGADELVDYSKADLKQVLRDLTGGKGVDVVYDCVGGPHAEPALRSTAWAGRYLVIGFAAGDIPKIPLNLLLLKGCELVGVFWGEFRRRDPEADRRQIQQVIGWLADGKLQPPHVHSTYALADTPRALEALERREATGKVIIRPRAGTHGKAAKA